MKRVTAPFSQAGLSLIELMVAITLGLMITASLGYILMGSRSTYRTQDASARVQDTGRFVLDTIGRNLRMAGRVEITPLAWDARVTLPAGVNAITGVDGVTAVSTGGQPATRNVDNLTVVYQLSNMGGGAIVDCNGNGAGIAKVEIKKIDGTSYSPVLNLSYGNVSNTIRLNPTIPASLELQCLGNGSVVPQPFAEGVEDLQFSYGIDTNADLAVDSWTPTPGNWNQVVAVQACIMIRSLGNGVVGAIQPVRDCSGNLFTPADTRLRRTFTSVFTLRNRINAVPQ